MGALQIAGSVALDAGPIRPRRPRAFAPSARLRNLSITAKLAAMVLTMVAIIALLVALIVLCLHITTGVRAYVGGEGLWSKGQKDAAYYLARYVQSRDPVDLRKYQNAIALPLGDHQARLELGREPYSYAVVEDGFVRGGNDAADVPSMVFLFRHFGSYSYLRDAIDIWRRADLGIAALSALGEEVRGAGAVDAARAGELRDRIEAINARLTPLEDDFSSTLGTGARWMQDTLLVATLGVAALLLMAGLWLWGWISRELRASILGLREGAIRVAQGDLDHTIAVRSGDELGELASVFNDMIQRRRGTEEALRSVSEFRDKVMHSASNAIFAMDLEGRYTLVNRRLAEITGYDVAELLNSAYLRVLPAAEHPAMAASFERAAHLGLSVSGVECTVLRPDLRAITVVFSLSPLYKDGHIVGVAGTAEDITERKRVEAALEKEREFLKAALEHLSDGLVACDENGVLSVFNRATREFHGLPEEPMPPERWSEQYALFAADGRTPLSMEQIPLYRAFQGEVVRDQEIVIRARQGAPRRVLCNGRAMVAASGRKLGAVVAMHDVTQRKRSEEELAARAEELARSNAELEQFAYVASHDLQEPLRTVSSYAQLLARRFGAQAGPEAQEYVDFLTDAVQRMRELIQGLLEYSRVGRQAVDLETVDLQHVLEAATANLAGAIAGSSAQVTHDPLPAVRGNPQQLVQLLQNLLGNALKFCSGAAPRVHIGAERRGEQWSIWVRDNGIGIDPQYAERVFALFQRLHTRDQYPGSGIGLSICRRIVEAHGGRIWVEPASPGALFRFVLPG